MQKTFIHLFAVMAAIVLVGVSGTAQARASDLPSSGRPVIRDGEELRYDIHWGFIKVGEASMVALANTDANDKASRHFRLTIRTTGWIDTIYKVRTQVDSIVDADITRSLNYQKKQLEGGIIRNDEVVFDWKRMRASYFSHGEYRQDTAILPGTFDPLGILYFFRLQDYATAGTIHRPVTDGKTCTVGKVLSVRRERLDISGASHDTTVIESRLEDIDGLFEESRASRFTLWFDNDRAGTPLKIAVEVFIGSITCERVSPPR